MDISSILFINGSNEFLDKVKNSYNNLTDDHNVCFIMDSGIKQTAQKAILETKNDVVLICNEAQILNIDTQAYNKKLKELFSSDDFIDVAKSCSYFKCENKVCISTTDLPLLIYNYCSRYLIKQKKYSKTIDWLLYVIYINSHTLNNQQQVTKKIYMCDVYSLLAECEYNLGHYDKAMQRIVVACALNTGNIEYRTFLLKLLQHKNIKEDVLKYVNLIYNQGEQ